MTTMTNYEGFPPKLREVLAALDTTNGLRLNFAANSVRTETTGTLISTGSTWLNHATAGQCAVKLLTSSSATSGDFACARFRGRADAAGNAEGVNSSASAGANNYGNLTGVYAAAQPMAYTQSGAANIVCGMHSVMDDTAAGASSGRRWSSWSDDHSICKASGGHYLHRLSSNGTVNIDGVWTIYQGGRTPYLINFEDVSGSLSASSSGTFTKTHKIALNTPDGVVYLQAGTIA